MTDSPEYKIATELEGLVWDRARELSQASPGVNYVEVVDVLEHMLRDRVRVSKDGLPR